MDNIGIVDEVDDTIRINNVVKKQDTDQIYSRLSKVLDDFFKSTIPVEGGFFKVPVDGVLFEIHVQPKYVTDEEE